MWWSSMPPGALKRGIVKVRMRHCVIARNRAFVLQKGGVHSGGVPFVSTRRGEAKTIQAAGDRCVWHAGIPPLRHKRQHGGKDRCLILIQIATFEPSVAYCYRQTSEGELRLMHQFAVAEVLPETAIENAMQPDQPSLQVAGAVGVISASGIEPGEAGGTGWWNRRQWIALSALMISLAAFALGRLSVSQKQAPVPIVRSIDPAQVGLAVRNHLIRRSNSRRRRTLKPPFAMHSTRSTCSLWR
jgi:hypothetical protein